MFHFKSSIKYSIQNLNVLLLFQSYIKNRISGDLLELLDYQINLKINK